VHCISAFFAAIFTGLPVYLPGNIDDRFLAAKIKKPSKD
jgi:hypothetical protein